MGWRKTREQIRATVAEAILIPLLSRRTLQKSPLTQCVRFTIERAIAVPTYFRFF